MGFLFFVVFKPLLWGLSRLPFRLLYMVSDISYFLLYRVVGYRKEVVRENLKLAFPDKSDKERRKIEAGSYRHLCDLFFEVIRSLNMSEKQRRARMKFVNIETLSHYKGRSVLYLLGHHSNWEWTLNVTTFFPNKFCAVYTKIKNKHIENLTKKIRESYYNVSVFERSEISDVMFKNHSEKIPSQYGFVSDQSPMLSKRNYYRPFFGVEVPCFTGYEFLAKRLNLVVFFAKMNKVKRGHYEVTLQLITDHPAEVGRHYICDRFYELLEQQIREQPEYYFWTHRRWKHRRA